MTTYEVKNVGIASMLKIVPVVFAILGTVIGLFTFFLFPTDVARDLTVGARLLSWLIFIVLYTLIMFVGIVVISWLYNIVAKKLGGISLNLETKQSL